jgi:hypothetical protein
MKTIGSKDDLETYCCRPVNIETFGSYVRKVLTMIDKENIKDNG